VKGKAVKVEDRTMLQLIPFPRDGVELAEMEGEDVLYSYEKEMMVHLNKSAVVIWRLCDGKRTVKEITELIADAFPEAADKVAIDVSETIARFQKDGVLELGEA
jgi:pyrroloquinoline quinone biosynthesis protein D